MNKKGFNLFTALLSFLFIIIAFLVVQTMTTTERKTTDQITAIGTSNNLQAIADMVKADAINSFNLSMRKSIETYVSQEDRPLTIRRLSAIPEDKDKYWEMVVEDYKNTRFGSGNASNFANTLASNITGYLGATGGFGNYSITYIYDGQGIKDTLQKTIEETEDFFYLVDCPNYDNCNIGTFYVNLDLTKLEDSEYEKLPKLKVEDLSTGEIIITPVLDKKKYKFYIPLRLFKALANGYKIAFSSNGLLTMDFHNSLENLEAGMCTKNYCYPTVLGEAKNLEYCYQDVFTKNEIGPEQPETLIKETAKVLIQEKFNQNKDIIEGLELKSEPEIKTIVSTKTSAVIVDNTKAYFEEAENLTQNKNIGFLEVYIDNQEEIRPAFSSYDFTQSEIDNLMSTKYPEATKGYSNCTQLTEADVSLQLEEKNLEYTVSGQSLTYYIKIVDYYLPFTKKYEKTSGKPNEVQDLEDALWYCYTKEEFEQAQVIKKGCVSAQPIQQ